MQMPKKTAGKNAISNGVDEKNAGDAPAQQKKFTDDDDFDDDFNDDSLDDLDYDRAGSFNDDDDDDDF